MEYIDYWLDCEYDIEELLRRMKVNDSIPMLVHALIQHGHIVNTKDE